jgi:hypothetical protein
MWELDLQLPMQSVPITNNVVSSWRGVLDITLCDKVRQLLEAGRWFSTGPPIDIFEVWIDSTIYSLVNLPHSGHFYMLAVLLRETETRFRVYEFPG